MADRVTIKMGMDASDILAALESINWKLSGLDPEGVKEVTRAVDAMRRSVKEADVVTAKFAKTKFTKMVEGYRKVATHVAIASVTIRNIARALGMAAAAVKHFTDAAIKQNDAVKKLGNTYEAMGRGSSKSMEELAESLERVSQFSSLATIEAANYLATMDISNEKMEGAVKISQDLAARFGMDLSRASQLVGKALQDPVRGLDLLARSGVTFSKSQREVIKTLVDGGEAAHAQAIVMGRLSQVVGGSAADNADSYAAKVMRVKEEFRDASVIVGESFLTVLDDLSGTLNENGDSLQTVAKIAAAFITESLKPMVSAFELVSGAVKKFNDDLTELSPVLEAFQINAGSIGKFFADMGFDMGVMSGLLPEWLQPVLDIKEAYEGLGAAAKQAAKDAKDAAEEAVKAEGEIATHRESMEAEWTANRIKNEEKQKKVTEEAIKALGERAAKWLKKKNAEKVKAAREEEALQARVDRVMKTTETQAEKYAKKLKEINDLAGKGALSAKQAGEARTQAWKDSSEGAEKAQQAAANKMEDLDQKRLDINQKIFDLQNPEFTSSLMGARQMHDKISSAAASEKRGPEAQLKKLQQQLDENRAKWRQQQLIMNTQTDLLIEIAFANEGGFGP